MSLFKYVGNKNSEKERMLVNNFLAKLERKYGRYAIKNLIVYLLAAYGIGYVLMLTAPAAYTYLELNPALVMKGQVWRLITWVCTVPESFSFFILFMFMFQYFIGSSLEKYWGSFRYDCYIFSGIFFMTISTMIVYWITGISMNPSTYYINMASFLAFAVCFPDVQVYFMMVIPLKIKWLAIIDVIYMAYEFIAVGQYTKIYAGTAAAQYASQLVWATRVSIIVSVLNFILFYFGTRNMKRFAPKEVHRRYVYKKSVKAAAPSNAPKHKCAICGRTEKDGDNLVFRYCSKCNGNYEFCQEHLYTHKHFE